MSISSPQRYPFNIGILITYYDFNLRNMITSPTRTPSQSCLDLIRAPDHLPNDYKVISSSISSLDGLIDHHLVSISMSLPLHRSARNKHVHKHPSPWLLSHISRAFQTTDMWCVLGWGHSLLAKKYIGWMWCWVPRCASELIKQPPPPPWMTPELQCLQRQRKSIYRQSIQNPTNTYLRQQFRPVRRQGTKLNK